MTEKRFTTVELPKPNRWGIWYDGAYLSTYQVCILLNEYVDVKKENEQLKQTIDGLTLDNTKQKKVLNATKKENEQLKQFIQELTTKGTGKIHLANGSIYKVDAILIDFKGDVE